MAKINASYLDDFAIGEDGNHLGATNSDNTLVEVKPETGESGCGRGGGEYGACGGYGGCVWKGERG